MSLFVVKGIASVGGVPTNGLQCVAFAEARFPVDGNGNLIQPVLYQPFPDANDPDGGPISSGETAGGPGHYAITVPDAGNYLVACYDPADPTTIAWEPPSMATPHTSRTGFTLATSPTRNIGITTIAAGSNGAVLPQGTINVVSTTTGFDTSGAIVIAIGAVYTTVKYTGKTPTSFTGCTGGTGTLATGQNVYMGYVNGANRRLVTASFQCATNAGAQQAVAGIGCTIGGAVNPSAATAGIQSAPTGAATTLAFVVTFPVDPLGSYFAYANTTGAGSVAIQGWTEVDF